MADTPLVWNINEAISINLFVVDPNTGLSMTGQAGYITLTIQRIEKTIAPNPPVPDSYYWSGIAWVPTLTFVTPGVQEVDAVNQPGRYFYTLPIGANQYPSRYVVHTSINNSPLIVGDAYEIHISRGREESINVYEIEPDDC